MNLILGLVFVGLVFLSIFTVRKIFSDSRNRTANEQNKLVLSPIVEETMSSQPIAAIEQSPAKFEASVDKRWVKELFRQAPLNRRQRRARRNI